MDFISRQEAKALGLKEFFEGEECCNGHLSDKLVSTGKCKECIEERNIETRLQYEDKVKAKTDKKLKIKESLSVIRETINEVSELERMRILTNFTIGDDSLDILPRTRKIAYELGEKFYDTGLPCKNHHLSKRITETGLCVECIKQNREEYKPYMAAYRQERRAREKNAEGFFSKEDIDLKLAQQKWTCLYCPNLFSETGYHIDHRIPLSKGGSNWPDNIQLLCPPCNLSKSNKLPEQFEKEIGYIGNE